MIRTARAYRLPFASWHILMAGLILSIPADAQASTLHYSTYLGGGGRETGVAVAAGPSGTTFIAGLTWSPDFLLLTESPAGPPPAERSMQLFVVALDARGHLLYSRSILTAGGQLAVTPYGIAVAHDGSAYVSYGFRLLDDIFAYMTRLSPFGEILSTQPLMDDNSEATGIVLDAAGYIYVSGYHNQSAFALKLTPDGSEVYSTILDGSGVDYAAAIAVDAAGHAFVTGFTDSPGLATPGAAQTALQGGEDAFLAELDPSGNLTGFTYLGGTGQDRATGVAVGEAGDVFVGGLTSSADFPFSAPSMAPGGFPNLFLTRLDGTDSLARAAFLRSAAPNPSQAVAFNSHSGLFWTGAPGVSCDGTILMRLDPASLAIRQDVCLRRAYARALAVDPVGPLSLTGLALEGLGTVNALQPFYGGQTDAFAIRLTLNRPPDCSVATAIPDTLWPPSGKFVPLLIRGVTDPDGDTVTLKITSVWQDEPLSRRGEPDSTGTGASVAMLRADRSGRGDGRVYSLSFQARDPLGAICEGTVRVCVPHDRERGRTCGDQGPLFDSAGK
jgi:hypothetical protein